MSSNGKPAMTRGIETLRKMMVPAGQGDPVAGGVANACFGVALGKVARADFDVDCAFEPAAQTPLARRDLLADAPNPVLLTVLDAGGGRAGLMWIAPLLVNAIVELMTGAPDKAVFREERLPTAVDAALCRGFCTNILRVFVQELAVAAGRPVLPELGYLRYETDVGKLEFVLEDTAHLLLSGTASFQAGLRGGSLALALPADLWRSGDTPPVVEPCARLGIATCKAPLELNARLDVLSMPVARAVGLKTGDILPISTAALSDLELMTKQGQVLFRGRLGQQEGKKAVLINGPAPDTSRGNPDMAKSTSPPAEGAGEPIAPAAADPATQPAPQPGGDAACA